MHFVFKFTWTSFYWEYFKNDTKYLKFIACKEVATKKAPLTVLFSLKAAPVMAA